MSQKTPVPVNNAPGAPAAIGPYSQAVKVGELAFLSGQLGMDAHGKLAEGFEAQARQIFANLQAVCQAAGGDLEQLVKLTVYLTDLGEFAKFNEVAEQALPKPYPARAAVGVASLPKGAVVEVEGVLHIS